MNKILLLFLMPLISYSQNLYNYGFNGTTSDMAGAGWTRTNQSTLPSSTAYWNVATYSQVTVSSTTLPTPFQNQAYTTNQICPIPNGQDGTPNTFALVNYASTTSTATSGATISNWLMSPVVYIQNGDIISFYSRIGKFSSTNTASFADNLQLRMSTLGSTTINPSTGPTDVGSYTNLLLEINPTFNLTSYPATWTQYSYTVSGLSGPTLAKLGFRYYVVNAGINGSNSDIIGLDTVSIERPLSTNDFFRNNFSFYPNPANDKININNWNDLEIFSIYVTDINGREIKKVNSGFSQINISDLVSGIYFLKISSKNGIGTSKIIKK